MWGPFCLLWMLMGISSSAPSESTVCPENCECSTLDNGLKAHCSSLDFLGKLRPKQIQEIVQLDVSSSSIKGLDHKLKKLKNLRKLNLSKNNIEELKNFPHLPHLTHLYLSHNHIKQFTASDLPKSIQHLDLSSNRIKNITDLSKLLPHLHEINFNDNILSCECDFLKYRDTLLLSDVHVVRPLSCYTPENVRGISMLSVYCAFGKVVYDDFERMLRDEPGSGADVSAVFSASTSSDFLDFDPNGGNYTNDEDGMEDEYFPSNVEKISPATEDESAEGSGTIMLDVVGGSGDGELIPVSPNPNIPHCYYNCSTPAPDKDTNSSAPHASISQEFTKLLDDITGKEEPSTSTTTVTTTTTSTTSTTSITTVKEEEVHQKSAATLSKTVPKEEPTVVKEDPEQSRAAVGVPKDAETTKAVSERSNKTTYIVVGVLFAAMVVLIAYVVVKRRNKRNTNNPNNPNNRRPASNHDIKSIELQRFMPESPRAPRTPPKTPIPVPEKKPLINGQKNGADKTSEAEEPMSDVTDSKLPVGNEASEEEEAQIRPKKDDDVLLTPGTKRVTIQAKELSSPKSPVLVHRHVGDDGKIVSSPVSNNEFKYT